MAKLIRYQFVSAEINCGTEEEPKTEKVILNKSMTWSEANEELAKREAYNGEYTIEDDGTEAILTDAQRIAELEEALALLLSGVTE